MKFHQRKEFSQSYLLDLSGNQLKDLYHRIMGLINLTYLNLGVNQLTGTISTEISNMRNLTGLYLNDNQFTGEIPESICNLTLDDNSTQLASNKFCPPYPSCIMNYVMTKIQQVIIKHLTLLLFIGLAWGKISIRKAT